MKKKVSLMANGAENGHAFRTSKKTTMSLKRFTHAKHLRGLGRPLLKRFFEKFAKELTKCQATLPPESLDDDEYFKALAEVFLLPEELPPEMAEVLYAVLEMANDKGVDRLTKAAKAKGLPIDWEKKATDLDIVMQVWLADEILMLEKHSEHRLMGMTAFQYWGTKTPPADRAAFAPPTEAVMEALRQAVDDWCRENHRGENTVSISKHPLDGEWWFLIQHGGLMARMPKVENQKTEILFYRPGKDDVVVYNLGRDEIRIHAGSKGEKELYRAEFGQRLRGDPAYFSERKNFVLDPLRQDVEKALAVDGLPDIRRIILQEVEMRFGGDFDDRTVRKSDDMVASAAQRSRDGKVIPAVPDSGKLVRAVFEVEFAHSKKPRKVQLHPPDELRVGRHGDLKAVHDWLTQREFRAATPPANGA